MMARLTVRVLVWVLACVLGGCMLGPSYKRPALNLPGEYTEDASGTSGLSVPADWWRLYGDPALDELVASGLQKNADIQLAIARIEEAEGVLREANASFLPEIDVNASAGRARSSTQTGTLPPSIPAIRNNFLLSANTSFELDFWGRLRRGREAARAQYLATRYGRDTVALTLAASIAQTYFNVRALDAQLVVSADTLKAGEDSLDIAKARSQAGVSPVRIATVGWWCPSPRASARLAIPASGARRFRSMSTASAFSGEMYNTRQRLAFGGTGSNMTRLMHQRNAVRVLPLPVGARMSVDSPRAIAGHPSVWGGVGASNEARNHSATAG